MNILKITLTLVIVLMLSACGGGDDGGSTSSPTTNINNESNITTDVTVVDNKGSFSFEYYGKWLRVDTKEELNIISSTVIDNYDIASENLIKVNTADTTYYLLRAGLSNIVVKGTLKNIGTDASASPSRAPSRIGGINVILENLLDDKINSSVQTDDEGNFETSSLPTGTYNLSLDDEQISTISISKPVEDIGVYKLTGDNLHNFKAELILDDEFLYADELVHTAKIRIHNISNQVGYGLFYTLGLNDSDLKSFKFDLVKGSIEAKGYADIPIELIFNQISQNSKVVSIDVTITDVENNQWADSFRFTLHKGYFTVNIATQEDSVKGYIIMPNTHKVKNVEIDGFGTIKLPLVSDEEYHLLLSNASFENETAYSLGINKATQSFKTFNYTPAHEPNNNEELASSINLNSSIVSYLHATDLDYWKIFLPESEYLFDFSLGEFKDVNANIGEMITSNTITITDKLTQGNNISAEIDNGVLVINGVDTNSTSAVVKIGDTLAIKLQAPLISGNVKKSALLIGQNTLMFQVFIDTDAPIFTSLEHFTPTVSDGAFVGNIVASDENKLSYSIEDGNSSYLFSIGIDSGELSFKLSPDYRLDFEHKLNIKATDILNNFTVQSILVKYERYTRTTPDVVVDHYTGNMWQDNIVKKLNWNDSVEYCDDLILRGYDDWSIPNIDILEEIIDDTLSPQISQVFQIREGGSHWSSTMREGNWYQPMIVTFSRGSVGSSLSRDYNFYVRCVRAGQ